MPRLNELPEYEALAAAVSEVFSRRVASQTSPGIRFVVFDASGQMFEGGFGTSERAQPRPRHIVASAWPPAPRVLRLRRYCNYATGGCCRLTMR